MKDQFEPDKGWVELNTNAGDIRECPKSLGLRDGGIVAFAFLEGNEDEEKGNYGRQKDVRYSFWVEWSKPYEEEEEEEGGVLEGGEVDDMSD